MGKKDVRDNRNITHEEDCDEFISPSKHVEYYKQRIDELEEEIKLLKKLVKKREKYEDLLKEKDKIVNHRLKGRKR